jgi:hypothetical protein
MAAPEYVPTKPNGAVRTYESPPRRPAPWFPARPGDLGGEGQPHGPEFGSQGPDQGYALLLAHRFDGKLTLLAMEDAADVTAGCVAVALKRASLFGRAPVIHDLTAAYAVFGFLDAAPPAELVELRKRLFAGVAHPHHYADQRRIADSVPEATLRLTPDVVRERHADDWAELLSVAPVTSAE